MGQEVEGSFLKSGMMAHSALRAHAGSVVDLLLDIVYPRECLLCDARIAGQPVRAVCLSCGQGLAWQQASLCHHCGQPRDKGASCPCSAEEKFAFDSVWSFGPYQGNLKKLVHAFKFQKNKAVGRDLAQFLLRSETLGEIFRSAQGIVPVPMHPLKEKDRGYNQAGVLAKELAGAAGLPCFGHALVKSQTSLPQVELGRDARWQNLSGTFAIGASNAIGRRDLILVDDVMTTGATAHHCAQLLRLSGARHIAVVVLARSTQIMLA